MLKSGSKSVVHILQSVVNYRRQCSRRDLHVGREAQVASYKYERPVNKHIRVSHLLRTSNLDPPSSVFVAH